MKNIIVFLGALFSLLSISFAVEARDTRLFLHLNEVLNDPHYNQKLHPNVKLFFGSQTYPAVERSVEIFSVSRKTNAINKTDEEACRWALLSALIALQERAGKLGANAVVGIVSNYRHIEFSSELDYECHAGNVVAGVALQGEVVHLYK